MTPAKLRNWAKESGLQDTWWISFHGGEVEKVQISSDEIEDLASQAFFQKAKVLHPSHDQMAHQPWIDLDMSVAPLKEDPVPPRQSRGALTGALLLIIPAVGIFLSISMIQHAQWILIAVVLSTVFVIMIDASLLAMADEGGRGPLFWGFVSLLFWCLAYPVYMAKRSKHGERGLGLVALFLTVVLILTVFLEIGSKESGSSLLTFQESAL